MHLVKMTLKKISWNDTQFFLKLQFKVLCLPSIPFLASTSFLHLHGSYRRGMREIRHARSAREKLTCPKEDTGPKPGYRYEAEHSGSMPAQLGEGPPDRSKRGPGLMALYTQYCPFWKEGQLLRARWLLGFRNVRLLIFSEASEFGFLCAISPFKC